jgi:hypothetical protein
MCVFLFLARCHSAQLFELILLVYLCMACLSLCSVSLQSSLWGNFDFVVDVHCGCVGLW